MLPQHCRRAHELLFLHELRTGHAANCIVRGNRVAIAEVRVQAPIHSGQPRQHEVLASSVILLN